MTSHNPWVVSTVNCGLGHSRRCLQGYYRYRTDKPVRAQKTLPEFLQETTIYDNPDVQKQFVVHKGDVSETSLILENNEMIDPFDRTFLQAFQPLANSYHAYN